ncbi:hypothetical protein RO3G_17147 [Rhizopus delemar RA 99-880]|uniref:Uncharacterized protein n=1 Tax=Rhizopus delemar (strain RA 99-880 / ATCC MYA-4621 / FGSC 9543 / NRRL 43880) TaxID=246409 RepID=I1CVR9_RHIO9|nr:hypothetical protein RO3G_17147 [Rhizopus delemar RA 99-880]|eukprot:EIE92549.1 hypothetical protein RO3G_17147 [Rhizopus delemar RA 99-880]
MNTAGQNVLASISNQSVAQGYRPKLIEFYGYEGEDFRHFCYSNESLHNLFYDPMY